MKFPFYESSNRTTALSAAAIQLCNTKQLKWTKLNQIIVSLHRKFQVDPASRHSSSVASLDWCGEKHFQSQTDFTLSLLLHWNKLIILNLGNYSDTQTIGVQYRIKKFVHVHLETQPLMLLKYTPLYTFSEPDNSFPLPVTPLTHLGPRLILSLFCWDGMGWV